MIKVTDRLKDGRLTSLVFDSKLNNSKGALTDEEVTITIRTVDLFEFFEIFNFIIILALPRNREDIYSSSSSSYQIFDGKFKGLFNKNVK